MAVSAHTPDCADDSGRGPWPDLVADFDRAWESNWPRCRPIGHELRAAASRSWVRFHSLPESKRYADDEPEYTELLSRHHALINDLSSLTDTLMAELVVVTVAWSTSSQGAEREPDLQRALPQATPWRTILLDDSDPEPTWMHLYVAVVPGTLDALTPLLRLVADGATADVIIGDRRATWLYHPYDGGGDVFSPSADARDSLRAMHRAWLPANAQGL